MTEETQATNDGTTEEPKGTTPETVEKGSDGGAVGTIPKERLDKEISKRKDLARALEESTQRLQKYEAAEKDAADAAARAAGDVEAAQKERDSYKARAEQWDAYAQDKLATLTDGLDEAGQEILAALDEDVPLAKRLTIAEKLAAQKKQPEPGFGSNGGKAAQTGGLIPASVASGADYKLWLAGLNTSAEGMAVLRDRNKMAEIRDEARRKKFV